jgi:hypothetical protein
METACCYSFSDGSSPTVQTLDALDCSAGATRSETFLGRRRSVTPGVDCVNLACDA